MSLKTILEYQLMSIGDFSLTIVQIISAIVILVAARFFLAFMNKVALKKFFASNNRFDVGRQYALRQFLKYIVYTLSLLLVLQTVGVDLSLLFAGSAALLVGMSLGLQQTFNDLFSGIILLIEGTVEVGDIVLVDDMIGKVKEIGIRTSRIVTRDQNVIIIPNSKLVTESVNNWSNNKTPTRFQLSIGVAYDSDIAKVQQLLLQAAIGHQKILKEPAPWIQFADFADSALQFNVHFYSKEVMDIEAIKSDVRFKINTLFKEHNVSIPFPQRELFIKNAMPNFKVANGKMIDGEKLLYSSDK